MQGTVTVKHATMTPDARLRMQEINERLSRYFKSIVTVRWVIGHVARSYVVTIRVHAKSGHYLARIQADLLGKGIDQAFDKIVRQRRRKRAATLTARRRRGNDALQAKALGDVGAAARIVQETDGPFGGKAHHDDLRAHC